MDAIVADDKRKKQKSSGHKHKGKKIDPKKVKKHGSKAKHGKRRSKSRSKSKKKSGFLCCRKKSKKRSKASKLKKRGSKSRPTKKQPKSKPVKTLPPVPNEQLGGVVLVKSGISLNTLQKQEKEQVTPEKEVTKQLPKTTSGETVNLSKEKIGTDKEQKEEKVEKPTVESVKGSENEKVEKVSVTAQEKEQDKKKDNSVDKKKKELVEKIVEKCIAEDIETELKVYEPIAIQVISKDSTIAIRDFEKVSGYIPAHVSKKHFMSNMNKNRFADVICLDHSRVTLTDSTFIHASWVNLDIKKKAILTQFPFRSTAADFWEMLIERKVKCVLLIMTNQEFKKFGGDDVFPKTQDFLSFKNGSIRVGEFKQIELGKGWVLKVLSITNGTYKSFIHVHHYKNWLHNSIPTDAKQIWQLQAYLQKYTEPHVYMSLSGCGRAGTYALFETAHASLHSEPPTFNMIKSLENVRNGRLHCVQTLNQFSFVYNLIAEHIINNNPCKENCEDQENSTAAVLRQLTTQ